METFSVLLAAGHSCGEFTGHQWIPRTKASHAEELDVWFDLRLNEGLSKQ